MAESNKKEDREVLFIFLKCKKLFDDCKHILEVENQVVITVNLD